MNKYLTLENVNYGKQMKNYIYKGLMRMGLNTRFNDLFRQTNDVDKEDEEYETSCMWFRDLVKPEFGAEDW